MCATYSSGKLSIDCCSLSLSLLQSSQRELARAAIICNHFVRRNEHVIAASLVSFQPHGYYLS